MTSRRAISTVAMQRVYHASNSCQRDFVSEVVRKVPHSRESIGVKIHLRVLGFHLAFSRSYMEMITLNSTA